MLIKQKRNLIITRVWLVLNVITISLCIWFYLGIQVTRKYEIDNSLNPSREQLLEISNSILDNSELLLSLSVIILLINIIILFINQRNNKIA